MSDMANHSTTTSKYFAPQVSIFIRDGQNDEAYTYLNKLGILPEIGKFFTSREIESRGWNTWDISRCCWKASLAVTRSTTYFEGSDLLRRACQLAQQALFIIDPVDQKNFPYYKALLEHEIVDIKKKLRDYHKDPSKYPELHRQKAALTVVRKK